MKHLFFFSIFLLSGFAGCFAQAQPGQSATHSVISFVEYSYDFGDKSIGADVSHKFEFRNVSKNSIAITEVKASCGCTTPKYATDPIKPGKKGNVEVKYDSKRAGVFNKTVTVMVNDGESIILTIKGNIKNSEAGAALPTR